MCVYILATHHRKNKEILGKERQRERSILEMAGSCKASVAQWLALPGTRSPIAMMHQHLVQVADPSGLYVVRIRPHVRIELEAAVRSSFLFRARSIANAHSHNNCHGAAKDINWSSPSLQPTFFHHHLYQHCTATPSHLLKSLSH